MSYVHKESIVACLDTLDEERVEYLLPNHDNTSCVAMTKLYDNAPDATNASESVTVGVFFNGRRVKRYHQLTGWNEKVMALSYDGSRLAMVKQDTLDDKTVCRVLVNGETRFAVPFDTVSDLVWLDNGRLACNAFNNEDAGLGIAYFIDGHDVTGSMDFEVVWAGQGRTQIVAREDGRAYLVKFDGSRIELGPCDQSSSMLETIQRGSGEERPEQATEQWINDWLCRVRYRGHSGPEFHGICSGPDAFVYNHDRSKVAYTGIRYSSLMGLAARGAKHLMDKAAQLAERQHDMPLWSRSLAYVFNPYFGPGHIIIEGSKRRFPVNDHKPWTKGYEDVIRLVYTSDDRLAALVCVRKGVAVSLEGKDGPTYDIIENIVPMPDGTLHYIACRGDKVYRVTVS